MPTKAPTKAAPKKAAAKKAPAKGGGAFSAPLTPSKDLAAVVGEKPLARTEAVSKIWDYIKKNNLQNPENKREIIADEKLKPVFGKPKVTMFEMNKYLSQHLK
jgi:chromatin remodeling complex protein RSC6